MSVVLDLVCAPLRPRTSPPPTPQTLPTHAGTPEGMHRRHPRSFAQHAQILFNQAREPRPLTTVDSSPQQPPSLPPPRRPAVTTPPLPASPRPALLNLVPHLARVRLGPSITAVLPSPADDASGALPSTAQRQVRIHLRRRYIRVPQQQLHAPQIRPCSTMCVAQLCRSRCRARVAPFDVFTRCQITARQRIPRSEETASFHARARFVFSKPQHSSSAPC